MKYICNKCFSTYENDTICEKCNNNLISLDDLISPVILILNKKGYKTISCCSGHNDKHICNKTYIVFGKGFEPEKMPSNFIKYNDQYGNITLCRYHKNKQNIDQSILNTIIELFNWAVSL